MQGIRYFMNGSGGNIEVKKCYNTIHSCKMHFHNEISIGFVNRGCSKTEIYDKNYEVRSGTLLMIPDNMPHKCTPHDYNNWEFTMFYVDKEWFKEEFSFENIEFSYVNLDENIFLKIDRLFSEIEKNEMSMESECSLIKYISMFNHSELNYKKLPKISRIKEVKKYLKDNYLSDLKLNDLSKKANVSKYYLIRRFEQYYGLSPHQYMINLRINYAKKLLKHNKDFTDIALESGFYDQSHFTRYFKEYTGVTPMEYKRCI
ncbi:MULTISPECIES: AraC family transcriptional regulator [Clostridium]|uniref:AraC family transcriptional regulator n=1 Tax=Clostridium TaxID=1485 RepID=UPI000824B871|nr:MULTISPECIES: AraC family transcriptional regulator [Clostridium]PJI08635.1 AraC family transcriptional regulator [Clostridium sp. CT7]